MIPKAVLSAFQPFLMSDQPQYLGESNSGFPKLKDEDLYNLINAAKFQFTQEPILLRLQGDFVIVGDLHGNLRDLLRIVSLNGYPPIRKYIFLGDYVDRGEFSIDILIFLFSLKLTYPECIYILRGNHEFETTNAYYGFKAQVLAEYDENMYHHFNDCFTYLPLACILNETFFLVHGGISPNLSNVREIEAVMRPITTYFEQSMSMISDLVWSDPGDPDITFLKNYRGFGYLFGALAAHTFLKQNNLRYIIRSHQCVNAIQKHFGGCVITVFSSSCYSRSSRNTMGIIDVSGENYKTVKYEAMDQLKKENVTYKIVELVERAPICFKKMNSQLKPITRPRRATVSEMLQNNRRNSCELLHTQGFPKLILKESSPKKERNSMDLTKLSPLMHPGHDSILV